MLIKIDPHNGLAIYDQVVRQIKFAVADGTLREGELVPSVRELARDLAINPNTVSRAYRELQSDQILQSVRGTGLIVKKSAPAKCRKERTLLIRNRLRDVLQEARQSQLTRSEVGTIIDSLMDSLNFSDGTSQAPTPDSSHQSEPEASS